MKIKKITLFDVLEVHFRSGSDELLAKCLVHVVVKLEELLGFIMLVEILRALEAAGSDHYRVGSRVDRHDECNIVVMSKYSASVMVRAG
eukprot:scaffold44472_cov54-Attheya_sp.AAC.5